MTTTVLCVRIQRSTDYNAVDRRTRRKQSLTTANSSAHTSLPKVPSSLAVATQAAYRRRSSGHSVFMAVKYRVNRLGRWILVDDVDRERTVDAETDFMA